MFVPIMFCFILLIRLNTNQVQQHMLSHILFPKLMIPFAFSRVALGFEDVLTQYMLHIRATGWATYIKHIEFRQHIQLQPFPDIYVVPVKSNLWTVPNLYFLISLSVKPGQLYYQQTFLTISYFLANTKD